MAKLIILEGLSRTGKTTISEKLKDEGIGRIISLTDKRPADTDIRSFYKGVSLALNEFYRAFPEETFILDRSFLSELVYSELFDRQSSTTDEYINDLIKSNDITVFYLYNEYEDYLNRSPKDRHVFSEIEYRVLKDLFKKNRIEIEFKELAIHSIDTSKNNLEEVYNIIKKQI